jgi:hypothetical protein
MAQFEVKAKTVTGSSVSPNGQTVGLALKDVDDHDVTISLPAGQTLGAAMNLIVAGDAALTMQNIGERPLFNIRGTYVHRSDILAENQCAQTLQLETGGSITFVLDREAAQHILEGLTKFLAGELPGPSLTRQ